MDLAVGATPTPSPKQHLIGGYTMEKYICVCGYEYDPAVGAEDHGIAPGTSWENVPEDFACPWCGLGKDAFNPA